MPLNDLTKNIDDLGPEIILNLKVVDAYRYPQAAVFFYNDLLQSTLSKYGWADRLEPTRLSTLINPDDNEMNMGETEED